MLRSEEERERRRQFGGEYRDCEQDDDDDDDDEEGEDEDEDEDDYEDDIEEEDEEDEEEQEDYEGENESQHYNDDVYNDTEREEYDPIAECDYGYENNINESDQSEDEHMEVIDLSDGSDEEQDETYYDGEEGAEVEKYQGHSSSPSPSSIYDDDASVYCDYHCQKQYRVSEDCYQDHLHHSAPLPPTEPSRQVVSLESMTNNMEDDQYFLDAVPEMKLAFGLDYSDDSNHLFGCLINHNIGNGGLHRQSSQMASNYAGEGTSMTDYLPPPSPPTLSTHQPKDDNDRGSSELTLVLGSMDDYQHLQQHKQQEQQEQQRVLQEHQQLDFGNKSAPQYPPEVITTSQVPDQITFQSHSSPEDQDQAQTQEGSITTTSTNTTSMTGTTRPRSSFPTLPGPISTYWKRLKRGPSSTPSSSRPPSFPP
jgi:hypothetical protein